MINKRYKLDKSISIQKVCKAHFSFFDFQLCEKIMMHFTQLQVSNMVEDILQKEEGLITIFKLSL